MKSFAIQVQRMLLATTVAAMTVMALPVATVYALQPLDSPTPVPPATAGAPRLEAVWERLQVRHDRLGVMFTHIDRRTALAQQLIDRAKTNGKDVTAVQSALDAFSRAVQDARPIFESTQGIIASHSGFDSNGNVTDPTQAKATVKDLSDKLMQVRTLLRDPATALRDAIGAFRSANAGN